MKHEWLPIDTAPKDGTAVLLWVENYPDTTLGGDGMPCAVTARYYDRRSEWSLLMAWGYDAEDSVYGNPTHWMPLPSPPEPHHAE